MNNAVGAAAVALGLALLFHAVRVPDVLQDTTSGSSLGSILLIVGVGIVWLGRVRRQDIRARSAAGLARPVIMRSTEATKGGVT